MNKAEFTKGFAWNFLFNAINRLAFPIIGILIARKLGPAEMGVFALYAAIVGVVDVFRDAGLGSTLIADRENKLGSVASYFWTSISISVALGLLVFGLKEPAAKFFHSETLASTLVFGSVGLLLGGLTIVPNSILQREARFRDAGLADFSASVVGYAVCIAMIFSGYGFEALLAQSIIRGALLTAILWILAKPSIFSPKLSEAKTILSKSLHLLVNNVQFTIYTTVDNTFIGKVFGEKALGLYGTMFNISNRPVELVSWPLGRTLFVAFTQAQHDRERMAHILARSYRATAFTLVPLYAFLSLYSVPFVHTVYSDKFEGAGPVLTWLSIYLGVRTFGTLGGTACVAIQRAQLNTLCWFAPYVVAISGIWTTWESRTLLQSTTWLTLGAVVGYGSQAIVALRVFKPTANDLRSILSAIAVSLGTVALSTPILFTSLLLPVKLLTGLLITGVAQTIMIGLTTTKNPWICFTPKGVKTVWKSM